MTYFLPNMVYATVVFHCLGCFISITFWERCFYKHHQVQMAKESKGRWNYLITDYFVVRWEASIRWELGKLSVRLKPSFVQMFFYIKDQPIFASIHFMLWCSTQGWSARLDFVISSSYVGAQYSLAVTITGLFVSPTYQCTKSMDTPEYPGIQGL